MNSSASQSLSRIFSRKYLCFSYLSFYIINFNYQIISTQTKNINRITIPYNYIGLCMFQCFPVCLNSLLYFVMSDNLCACHCGTRITIDEQLLEEREMWKQKYSCLQKQAINDIGKLKENIYAECSVLMQKEFAARQTEQSQIINDKNIEIKSLTSRVINLEAKLKISQKENEILRNKARELQQALVDRESTIQNLKSRSSKGDREWQARIQEQLTALRKRISEQYQGELQQKQGENEHLRHKVKEFEKKYQVIIPEVQKLKNALTAKNQQIQQLESKLEKIKKEGESQLLRTRQEADEIDKLHSKCRGTINKLSEKVDSLSQELQQAKKVKKEIKIEPVYIERPVEVERVVEKIVQVQKIVNKYIEPTTFRDQQLQAEIKKLKQDNANLLRELHLFEEKYITSIKEYEQMIKQYEQNQVKYKKEREQLAKRLIDQQREIDTIHAYIQKRKIQSQSRNEPQKITIHVNKDGRFQKTVERVASNSGMTTQANVKVSKKR